ncbi:MAG: hypothetical protein PWQ37_2270 [Candidatus Petromonas sp.]|nr:hypothetical protein [Candidatus Petromonas sp.]
MELLNAIFLKVKTLSYFESFLRTTILYFFLFLSAKTMGYRHPSIITPYNFIMAAGISHIAAARMVNPESRVLDAIIIIIIYTLINLLWSFLYLKAPRLVSQSPTLLVEKGKVVRQNLSKSNLTIHNLLSALRLKNAFSVKNVDYALLEPSGEISVLIDSNYIPPQKSLLGIQDSPRSIPEIIIYRGKIDKDVMIRNGLDSNWLNNELMKNNIEDISKVYLGILESDKTLYIN